MIDDVRRLTRKYYPTIKQIRRKLHEIPELGNKEIKTKAYIKQQLKLLTNFEIEEVLETGLIASIKGTKTGNIIALRADMDALPIEEVNEIPYKSKHPGLMHACGHDAHMAILLGVAYLLNDLKDCLKGEVKLVFQPAEETTGGAEQILNTGCLKGVKAIFGLHVDSNLNVGEVLYRSNEMYASSNAFDIDIFGDATHIANSNTTINALEITTLLLDQLFKLSNKYSSEVLLGFGKIEGGKVRNVLPGVIHLEGTLRTTKKGLNEEIIRVIFLIIKELEERYNTKIMFKEISYYPLLINNEELEDVFLDTCHSLKIKTKKLQDVLYTAEDFSWYNRYIPSYFYNIGSGNNFLHRNLHSNDFMIDEKVLYYGVLIQTLLVFNKMEDLYVKDY